MVDAHTFRGARSISPAMRCHTPRPSSVAALGLAGQYAVRPSRARTAGRKVRVVRTAQRMPIAPTGPSARLLVRSLASRASRPSATVAALAVMAPAERRTEAVAARMRSPWAASSSRKRAARRRA
ncbi:hypothetical protein GCM10009731_47780 [Streptomyces globosus]